MALANPSIRQMNGVLQAIHEQDIRFLALVFTDVLGNTKSVTVPAKQAATALNEGVWFDGSSTEGFARVSESDMYLVPDPDTFSLVGWTQGEHAAARVICDVKSPDGELFMGAPRCVLQQALACAERRGISYQVGVEIEYYLLRQDDPEDIRPLQTYGHLAHSLSVAEQVSQVRRDIMDGLEQAGVPIEGEHSEKGPAQLQVDLCCEDALSAADHTVLAKEVIRSVSQRAGLVATFMPKPFADSAASSMHIQQRLLDQRTGQSVVGDAKAQYGLSELGERFLAGQLAHVPGMSAVLAPLVNSYKRLGARRNTSSYVSWGRGNRSALVRVTRTTVEGDVRLEVRLADAACNPYLAFAELLVCGLDGMEQQMALQAPTDEDLFLSPRIRHGIRRVPLSLGEALVALQEDEVVQLALGAHTYRWFLEAKSREWRDYSQEVTPWEHQRYFHLY